MNEQVDNPDSREGRSMTIRFDGKVAIVTGGAVGIGAATTRKLWERGAPVAFLDRDTESAQTTVDALLKAGHNAASFPCDVSNEDSVHQAIDAALQRYGALHVLVSNAGTQRYGDVVHTSAEVWDETFGVHVKGCVHMARLGIPAMLASGG